MAIIPSNIRDFNDEEISSDGPLTESLMYDMGAALNFLAGLTGKFEVFTSSGTWTVPEGITRAYFFGAGGGGGGGGGASSGGGGGGNGGYGAVPFMVAMHGLTPLDEVTVSIGAGGSGGATNTNGTQGGNTSVSGTGLSLTFGGAPGGLYLPSGTPASIWSGRGGFTAGGSISAGESSVFASGGASGFGGGGGAGFGAGGAAAPGQGTNGSNASANSSGGGGGANRFGGAGGQGGNGGSGLLVIYY